MFQNRLSSEHQRNTQERSEVCPKCTFLVKQEAKALPVTRCSQLTWVWMWFWSMKGRTVLLVWLMSIQAPLIWTPCVGRGKKGIKVNEVKKLPPRMAFGPHFWFLGPSNKNTIQEEVFWKYVCYMHAEMHLRDLPQSSLSTDKWARILVYSGLWTSLTTKDDLQKEVA